MPTSEPSVRDLLWRGLNPLGQTATVLMFVFTLGYFLAFIFGWELWGLVRPRQPSLAHYIAHVLLMMIDVPLAWSAWKALKSDRGRRALVVMFLIFILMTFIEARTALQRDERWFPKTPIMVLYTLVFIQLGVGRKRPFPSGTPAPPRVG